MEQTFVFDGKLTDVEMKPVDETSRIQFRLHIESSSKTRIVQFVATSGDAMAILSGLQTLQRRYGWRLPSYRAKGWKPKLVKPGDDA